MDSEEDRVTEGGGENKTGIVKKTEIHGTHTLIHTYKLQNFIRFVLQLYTRIHVFYRMYQAMGFRNAARNM